MNNALVLVSKSTKSEGDSLLPGEYDTSIDLRVSSIEGDNVTKVNVEEATRHYQFSTDYSLWKQETSLLSVNNFENRFFNSIVEKGEESVPFIYEQLKKGPSHLIYALELIYPDKIHYNKKVTSLKRARRIWLKILKVQLGR